MSSVKLMAVKNKTNSENEGKTAGVLKMLNLFVYLIDILAITRENRIPNEWHHHNLYIIYLYLFEDQ